jgi:hypothetical protein
VTYGELTSTRVFLLRAEAVARSRSPGATAQGMPMPRADDEAVRVEREHVVVVFTLRLREVPPPEQPENAIVRVPDAVRAWAWIEADR